MQNLKEKKSAASAATNIRCRNTGVVHIDTYITGYDIGGQGWVKVSALRIDPRSQT